MDQLPYFNEDIPKLQEQSAERQIHKSLKTAKKTGRYSFEPCEYIFAHTGKAFFVENGNETIISLYYNPGPEKGRIAYEMIFPRLYVDYWSAYMDFYHQKRSVFSISYHKTYLDKHCVHSEGPHNFKNMILRECTMDDPKMSELAPYGGACGFSHYWHTRDDIVCCHTPLDEYKQPNFASIIVKQWYPNGQLFSSVTSNFIDFDAGYDCFYPRSIIDTSERYFICNFYDRFGIQISKFVTDDRGKIEV
jgi:hypothetical protein